MLHNRVFWCDTVKQWITKKYRWKPKVNLLPPSPPHILTRLSSRGASPSTLHIPHYGLFVSSLEAMLLAYFPLIAPPNHTLFLPPLTSWSIPRGARYPEGQLRPFFFGSD